MNSIFSNLFKKTLKFKDDESKIKHISKIISKIAEILPFNKSKSILINDKELNKFMLLCYPYAPKLFSLIISQIIYRYQNEYQYIKNLVKSIEEILCLQEANNEMDKEEIKKKKKTYIKLDYSNFVYDNNSTELPKEVYENWVNLKIICLEITKKITKIIISNGEMFKQNKDHCICNLYTLFKNMLTFSSNHSLLMMNYEILEICKEKESYFFEFNEYDQIKSLLNQKMEENIQFHQFKKDKLNDILSHWYNRILSKTKYKYDPKLKKECVRLNKKIKKIGVKKFIKKKMKLKLQQIRDTLKVKDNKNYINNHTKDFKDVLEIFLLNEDYLLHKNKTVYKELCGNNNISILFVFIFSPFNYELSNKFKDFFYDKINKEVLFEPISLKRFFDFKSKNIKRKGTIMEKIKNYINESYVQIFEKEEMDFQKISEKFPKNGKIYDNTYYHIRSFLTAIILTNLDNHNLLKKNNKNFIVLLYENLYKGFKENLHDINIHLIIYLLNFYLINDPSQTLAYFIKYNLIYLFLENINNNKIRGFIIDFIIPSKIYNFENFLCNSLWNYLEISGFFDDLLYQLLYTDLNDQNDKFNKDYTNIDLKKLFKKIKKFNENNNTNYYCIFKKLSKFTKKTVFINEKNYNLTNDIDSLNVVFKNNLAKKKFLIKNFSFNIADKFINKVPINSNKIKSYKDSYFFNEIINDDNSSSDDQSKSNITHNNIEININKIKNRYKDNIIHKRYLKNIYFKNKNKQDDFIFLTDIELKDNMNLLNYKKSIKYKSNSINLLKYNYNIIEESQLEEDGKEIKNIENMKTSNNEIINTLSDMNKPKVKKFRIKNNFKLFKSYRQNSNEKFDSQKYGSSKKSSNYNSNISKNSYLFQSSKNVTSQKMYPNLGITNPFGKVKDFNNFFNFKETNTFKKNIICSAYYSEVIYKFFQNLIINIQNPNNRKFDTVGYNNYGYLFDILLSFNNFKFIKYMFLVV